MGCSVFVHIVTFNDSRFIGRALESLLDQEGFKSGKNLTVEVADNASSDNTAATVEAVIGVPPHRNCFNIGFAAAHNRGVARFLESSADYLVILNPDVRLCRDALLRMAERFDAADSVDCIAPLLYRSDDDLMPLEPRVIDAAGMYFTRAIRHLDRGSGECDSPHYREDCMVAGASGACLMLRRRCIEKLLLRGERRDKDVFKVYPVLEEEYALRAPFFDEAFFAYREDADLAWRAAILDCRTQFVPKVEGYHRRRARPDNRASLPPEINRCSVRNRFLLQVNNLSLKRDAVALLDGFIIRNIIVIGGVLLRERSSLGAFKDLALLLPRALERRKALYERADGYSSKSVFVL